MDGVSDTIKNLFFREVKSERLVVESLDDFSVHAKHIVEEIVTIYLRNEVFVEPTDTEEAPYIKGTLKVHNTKNQSGVNYPKFNHHLSSITCQIILLCETIILSMMDLTTVHTVIRFSRKVETGLSTQLPSCGTVANIAFQYKNCNKVPVGRKRVPASE